MEMAEEHKLRQKDRLLNWKAKLFLVCLVAKELR